MEIVQSYKCPGCGAPLIFNAKTQNMRCKACGNEFSADTLNQISDADIGTESSKYDWEEYTPREFGAEEAETMATYTCPSCAAEITGDEALGAAVCPYCGNTTVIKGKFEGSFMPDYVIPFKIDKKSAVDRFMKTALKKKFIPKEFKDMSKLSEIVGMYVPFWTFDCEARGECVYNANRVRMWSDSRYNYTETTFYKVYRGGDAEFSNVPVDGSKKADDNYMEAIEPFDYSEALDFNTTYLSGYLADKYDVSAKESQIRANERIKRSMEDMLRETVRGYDMVIPNGSSVRFDKGKIRYALLPVWWLNIKYNNKIYKFAMNGQTGKTVGKYPASFRKIATCFAAWYALFAIIGLLIWYFLI